MGSSKSKIISKNVDVFPPIKYENMIDKQLMDLDLFTVPDVLIDDKIIRARVVDVYDGDTITVVFFIGKNPIKIKIRLLGIDTPELRSKSKNEKTAAIKSRDYLKSLVLNKIVNLEITDWDKYGGRVLGNIYMNDSTCINTIMIDMGYGKSYTGAKKSKWTRSELKNIGL